MTERPKNVTGVIWLFILNIILSLLYLLSFVKDINSTESLTVTSWLYIAYYIIMIVVFLIIAIGLYKGIKWSWYGAIIVMIIGLILAVVYLDLFVFIIRLAVVSIVVYYLTRPDVKEFFKIKIKEHKLQ